MIMAHQSSSITYKDVSTCQESYSYYPTLADQLNILLKFDERESKLCGFIDKAPLEILKFFCDIVLRKGSTTQLTIDYLYSQILKANPKVQQIIRNPKDVREFFSKYCHLFTIDGDKIFISESTVLFDGQIRWIKTLLQSEYPDINKTVLNAIQFYSDILYEKANNFPIDQLVTHRNKAKLDVQLIAVNPVELKSFLIAYPQIFNVNDDKVSLTYSAACDRSDYIWLGELCGVEVITHNLRLLGKTVMYYLLILFKQKNHQLPLSKLFAFRNFAPKDVKKLTKTVADLKKFFVQYNCVFQINKNIVLVKDSFLIDLKRYEFRLNVLKGNDLSTKEVIYMIQENLIKTALDICIKTIKNKLNLKCSLEVPLQDLISEFDYLFENADDLKTFLSYHSSDFIIKDDTVLLKKCDDIYEITDTSLKYKLLEVNKSVKQVSKSDLIEQAKDFCVNFLLQNVGVDVQFSLIQFKECISLAPPELQQILRNKEDFLSIINRYDNVLSVTDNYILLKKDYDDPDLNLPKLNFNESLMFFVWVLKEKVGAEIEFPIARLKIYLDLAPSEVRIQGISQLKTFFKKYPNVFIVINNNVILKNLNEEKFTKIARYENLDYIESYSTSEAIAFYTRVLSRFCFNLEVPVEHLFGYRSLAPIEVIAVAKTPCELKKFLSTHPDIFTVQENYVCLTKSFDRCKSIAEVYGDQETIAIKFYSSILDRVSYKNEFPIVRLFGYQYLASPEIQDVIKTPLELKEFLSKYSDVFFVNNDVVLLKNSVYRNKDLLFHDKLQLSDRFLEKVETTLKDLKLYPQSTNKAKSPKAQCKIPNTVKEEFISKKSTVIRAIRFYSNIMFKKGPNSEHLVSNLLCFRSEASNEIKEIAKKPGELLKFLSEFPQIFTINSSQNTVMLTDMVSFYKNERNWIKELLPKYHQSTTNHESVVNGIQFYVNHIFETGLEVLSIKSLFRHRKTAMEDVQALTNSGIELKDFLSMYPEIFKLSDEGVSLTAAAVSHKVEPKWIEEIIGDSKFMSNSMTWAKESNECIKSNLNSSNSLCNQDKDLTLKDETSMTINFFKSKLEAEGENKSATLSKLFEYLSVAPKDVTELFNSHSELKDFFIKYPDVFTVKDNFVGLVFSENISKVKKKKKKRSVKNLESSSFPVLGNDSSNALGNHENLLKINNMHESNNHLTEDSEKKYQSNIVSSLLFYSSIIFRKGPHLEHNIGNIFSHNSKASSDVRETVKNTKEFKEFLSKYPQLFSVNHEKQTVSLSDFQTFHENQRSWIKALLPKHHQSTTNHETIVSTIQFYSNILFEKYPKCELLLSILFSYRNTAMEDVQMTSKNIKELYNFFSLFPDIFKINKDKVSLTESVISQLRQPKWMEQLVNIHESSIRSIQLEIVNSTETTVNEEFLKKKKIITRKAVQFFYKFLLSNVSNKEFSLSELFDYLREAPHDVQEVAKSIAELREFFLKYPHIFTITNSVVFLTSFNSK